MLNLIKQLFLKELKDQTKYIDPNLLICHLVYNTKNQHAYFWIDYANSLEEISVDTEEGMEKISYTADQFANFLFSICNIKGFLPSLVMEELSNKKTASKTQEILVNLILGRLDQIISTSEKIETITSRHKSMIKPSQVFKNGK